MKVSIPVKKTVKETVEFPRLPYYSTQYGVIFYMITEEQSLIQVTERQIVFWKSDNAYYGESLVEAYHGEPCTKEEFDKAVAATLQGVNSVLNPASGQSGVNYMQDPNLQQQPANQEAIAEQVATGQEAAVQATEQQAQEEALESAEEGSTEG